MNDNGSSAREILERLVQQSGITKKLATQILHTIPDIIEVGLKKDGEVRVKGLGTFRLRWTRGKVGRNPKTGERVDIPSHNRVIFLPEQSFKEYIKRDNRLLNYKIIPEQKVIEQNQYQYQAQYQPKPEPLPEQQPENVIETDIETELELEPPSRKKRIHWIVPLAISVVIILSLVFYFRISRQSTVDSRQSAVGSRQSSVSSRQSSVGSQQSAVGGQKAVEPIEKSEIRNPKSELNTQNSKLNTISEGTRLFKLAREIYGNPYLWVLIYKENLDKITDPDMLISGRELVIPVLEGSPDLLTRNDSLAVSEGYRLVYEFYKSQDETRAKDFFRAMKRYRPK